MGDYFALSRIVQRPVGEKDIVRGLRFLNGYRSNDGMDADAGDMTDAKTVAGA